MSIAYAGAAEQTVTPSDASATKVILVFRQFTNLAVSPGNVS
jgi:hypothetical protein